MSIAATRETTTTRTSACSLCAPTFPPPFANVLKLSCIANRDSSALVSSCRISSLDATKLDWNAMCPQYVSTAELYRSKLASKSDPKSHRGLLGFIRALLEPEEAGGEEEGEDAGEPDAPDPNICAADANMLAICACMPLELLRVGPLVSPVITACGGCRIGHRLFVSVCWFRIVAPSHSLFGGLSFLSALRASW